MIDQEWDTERVLEASAASFVLLGTFLGFTSNRRWHLFSGVISYFLLQHSVRGWCPPLPLIRGSGIRTANDINEERNALKSFYKLNNYKRPQTMFKVFYDKLETIMFFIIFF
ncbi:DUF2892 domain-containing protein [Alkalihalobacillus sp. MEB130]|nr:DUF2892 domain-containing protein [Alkalihalobacillus sp. MEB130]